MASIFLARRFTCANSMVNQDVFILKKAFSFLFQFLLFFLHLVFAKWFKKRVFFISGRVSDFYLKIHLDLNNMHFWIEFVS